MQSSCKRGARGREIHTVILLSVIYCRIIERHDGWSCWSLSSSRSSFAPKYVFHMLSNNNSIHDICCNYETYSLEFSPYVIAIFFFNVTAFARMMWEMFIILPLCYLILAKYKQNCIAIMNVYREKEWQGKDDRK